MKKILTLTVIAIMFAGCAMLTPVSKINWDTVNSADMDNLKAGKIALAPAVVIEAVSAALKDEGWQLDTTQKDAGTITTVRKHGVTFYGSCDYAMSCKVTAEGNISKLNWTTISYVSEFLTNVDPAGNESADRWNYAVYTGLIDKGAITKDAKAAAPVVEKTAAPAATTGPVVKDSDLPPPPTEE